MKALLQRVTSASVTVDGETVGKIGHGLVVFIGVANDDTQDDIEYLLNKIPQLRIFDDTEGKFNLSALDLRGELLLVSQFTLLAATRKGRRPGFTDAAPPDIAENLFNQFVAQARLPD
jgi:D-tyrosyl-tRNA(Tyr) deacylase